MTSLPGAMAEAGEKRTDENQTERQKRRNKERRLGSAGTMGSYGSSPAAAQLGLKTSVLTNWKS